MVRHFIINTANTRATVQSGDHRMHWKISRTYCRNPSKKPRLFSMLSQVAWILDRSSSYRSTGVCSSQKWFASPITAIWFIAILINRYNDGLLPLLRQLLLIPSRIHKCVGLWTYCPLTFLKQLRWNAINTWWFVPFYLFSSHLKFKDTKLRL